jgi:hypothetical protein
MFATLNLTHVSPHLLSRLDQPIL